MGKPKTPVVVTPDVEVVVSEVSRETLEGTPTRALVFLRAAGTIIPIRTALAARGYSEQDHLEGWSLLHAVSGYGEEAPSATVDVKVRDAMNTLDNQDEDIFRVVSAALVRSFPAQAQFVLNGIGPSTGARAVVGVKALLGRLDALENGEGRAATRKQDKAALASLAKFGIDTKERARLAALVKAAESATMDAADGSAEQKKAERDEAYLSGLRALRGWFEQWSEIARVVVKRRDYLIKLGLASRKAPKKAPARAKADTKAKPAADNKPADNKPAPGAAKPTNGDATP